MNSLEWLQDWYYARCDDEWEHQHGITIQSLDNPGWLVKIDLAGTPMSGGNMQEVGQPSQVNHHGVRGDHDWLHCKIEEGFFIGAGGPLSLFRICDAFRDWVSQMHHQP
jgi:hypothetical protein